jgi:hypothetical protein
MAAIHRQLVLAVTIQLGLVAAATAAVPSICEDLGDGVVVVRDDVGMWRGDLSQSITHQSTALYQARKILDLSALSEAHWNATHTVRLSMYFVVRDYSPHLGVTPNGLDESIEIVVNGHVHSYPTNVGAPIYNELAPQQFAWYDFELPKSELTRGPNEIIVRKAPSEKNDDYIYLGIDETEVRGNSSVTFDGQNWIEHALTVPGGKGEYMIRLYLLAGDQSLTATWTPTGDPPLDDPDELILYAGSRTAELRDGHLVLSPTDSARIELAPDSWDPSQPLNVQVEGDGPLEITWLTTRGKEGDLSMLGVLPNQFVCETKLVRDFSGMKVRSLGGVTCSIKRLTISGARAYHPRTRPIDMCPPIAPPAGQPAPLAPRCQSDGTEWILENSGLRCVFRADERLQLVSLFNRHTDCEMLSDPGGVALFLVEVGDHRYAGSRDFRCRRLTPQGDSGFAAELKLTEPAFVATLTARIEEEGLRLGLSLTNTGDAPQDFKLAFPHLQGLAASGQIAADYYYFPWGGGIIADRPASIRRGYGDHEALYQIMDLFSPARGGGLYLRIDDREGWHKGFALRKCVPGVGQEYHERMYVETKPEYLWKATLPETPGTGLACEYLRRTREPQATFEVPDALLCAHPGDWHTAMQAYAAWAHRVWKFRPYPSRLRSIHHMMAVGWGQDILFREGKYRDDFLRPETDCVELMSWWDWADHGPFNTPFDRLAEVLTADQIKLWEPYFVRDPVTGKQMWDNQPGDYAGYNERFGGLPALRNAIETYKQRGALVTLYTDPFRLDGGCPTGAAHGEAWTVVLADGKRSRNYDVWNPCHDMPEVRQWVAATMRRVMQDTGADGIRLDEYGHKGWACFSTEHPHTFSEPGVSQWNKSVADATRLVREAMDEVAPGSVVTTEHPAYDYLMQYIDGCITYDVTVQACPLRPLECNTQRFYFPECKAFELDHQGADLESYKKIWNAVASFGRYYPPAMYALLRENDDVYQDGTAEPLVPTLQSYVYANRFHSRDKTLIHLYNATQHTVDGPVFRLQLEPTQHLFDMLTLREVPLQVERGIAVLERYMPRDTATCVALLPRKLQVSMREGALHVSVSDPEPDCRIVVCDSQTAELTAAAPSDELVPIQVPRDGKPACVKLLMGNRLIDVAEVPQQPSDSP